MLAAALVLGGCQSAQEAMEGKIDYKSERKLQPLEIPPDLTAPQGDNRYQVPESGPSSATYSGYQSGRRDPRAPGTAVLPEFDQIRVERAGTQRWLVVQEPAERLWPRVRDFWAENGFLLKTELPEAGVMETDWAENRAKIPQGVVRDLLGKVFDQLYTSSERDKFRTRLERTADGKGTEIYVSHRGMQEVYTSGRDPVSGAPGQTAWAPRDTDPELEAEFLRRLMVRLGSTVEQAKQAAAGGVPQFRAELKKGNAGVEALQVLEPFDRAWRRVGLALDRVGFTVEDRDRQKGVYFVRYADPEAESKDGFFSRMFGSDKNKAEQYRVQVMQAGANSQVNVLDRNGGSDSSKTAQRILSLLHEQLK
ncbi:MAG TPA: outer membrane protein assembly factor BamC [Burkholderiales bacterium]